MMEKPKAKIYKGMDDYTVLETHCPNAVCGSLSRIQFDPDLSEAVVLNEVKGLIDALHEALDEVEGDE